MAKVTSKLQVTIPKALAERSGIRPGDDIEWSRGMAAYQFSFDAHLWAYAEAFGLTELLSEGFQHGRFYGSVRAINPFALR